MPKETLKKMLLFSSVENKIIVEKIVADVVYGTQRSGSSVYEESVLLRYLPKNKDFRAIATNTLYNDKYGVKAALGVLVRANTAGINYQALHDNYLPFVMFAYKNEIKVNRAFSGQDAQLGCVLQDMDSVSKFLQHQLKNEANPDTKSELQKGADWCAELIDLGKREPELLRLINVYRIIIDYWDALKGWTTTYYLLDELIEYEKKWPETPSARLELLSLMKKVEEGWEGSM